MSKTGATVGIAFAFGAMLGLTATVILVKYNQSDSDPVLDEQGKPIDFSKFIMDGFSTKNIEENLRFLSQKPHVAGLEREENDVVNYVADGWKESGLDVELHPYDVLLSYPNDTDPNYVAIISEDGTETYMSSFQEEILDTAQNTTGIVTPYNAYSPPGEPEGDLVYVNFASISDFVTLNTSLGIDTRGKICIARYGKVGNKEQHAAQFGCKGLILYSDPMEYTVSGEPVYPETWYLPGSAARRGGIFVRTGDPLTLNYPATETAWRMEESDIPLPTIPVTPIGYDDAKKYLSKMAGPDAPAKWQGGLNIPYKLGPGFAGEFQTKKMKMSVKTRNERKTIHNVIGYIRGTVEPDRYVLMGNHRDAWAFGAIDPSSSTAVMLELARVYGEALKKGWKPRRTIVFCSWGGEEFGLIGSTEWVEEFQKIVGARATAYVNVDASVAGVYSLYAMATPSLKGLIFDVAKVVPNPDKGDVALGARYIYDSWRRRLPANPFDPNTEPLILPVSTGSDYAPFAHIAGVPVLDFAYVWDPRLGLDFYPVYHTVYETFDLVKRLLDPDFTYHEAVGRVWGEVGLRLSDSPVLPLNCADYAHQIETASRTVMSKFGKDFEANGIDTGLLTAAAANLTKVATDFHDRIAVVDFNNPLAVRAVNDQLMYFERAFIDGHGITGNDQYRHVILSPSKSGLQFPGLVDSIEGIDVDENQQMRWNEVKRQYSILLYHLGSATSVLKDFTPIKGQSNL